MSDNILLEHVVKETLFVVEPWQDDKSKRYHVLEEFQEVLGQSNGSLRGATVKAFGSFASDLCSRWGDLDISIDLPKNGFYTSPAYKKRKQNLLKDLERALRGKGGWCRLKLILHSRVPILKVYSSRLNISCDISIDNLVGQLKSKILLWINEIDGRFRDVVLLVKEWAKAQGINDPNSGTFNSFSLTMLVLFHLQTCEPPILPTIRDIYPGNMVDYMRGEDANAENRIAEICAANINKFKWLTPINQQTVPELLVAFFAKFSVISSMAPYFVICPYTGQWEDIESNVGWSRTAYAVFIEDPFEWEENTARAVNENQLKTRISEVFKRTYQTLISVQNPSSMVAELARPQLSRSIATRLTILEGIENADNPQLYHSFPQLQSVQRIYEAQPYFPQASRATAVPFPPQAWSVYEYFPQTHNEFQYMGAKSHLHNSTTTTTFREDGYEEDDQIGSPRADSQVPLVVIIRDKNTEELRYS